MHAADPIANATCYNPYGGDFFSVCYISTGRARSIVYICELYKVSSNHYKVQYFFQSSFWPDAEIVNTPARSPVVVVICFETHLVYAYIEAAVWPPSDESSDETCARESSASVCETGATPATSATAT